MDQKGSAVPFNFVLFCPFFDFFLATVYGRLAFDRGGGGTIRPPILLANSQISQESVKNGAFCLSDMRALCITCVARCLQSQWLPARHALPPSLCPRCGVTHTSRMDHQSRATERGSDASVWLVSSSCLSHHHKSSRQPSP